MSAASAGPSCWNATIAAIASMKDALALARFGRTATWFSASANRAANTAT